MERIHVRRAIMVLAIAFAGLAGVSPENCSAEVLFYNGDNPNFLTKGRA
jgi:hypothetical protein